eukprot:6281545-Pyramimonas_sp.AAC.1
MGSELSAREVDDETSGWLRDQRRQRATGGARGGPQRAACVVPSPLPAGLWWPLVGLGPLGRAGADGGCR